MDNDKSAIAKETLVLEQRDTRDQAVVHSHTRLVNERNDEQIRESIRSNINQAEIQSHAQI